jgi:hypothetical protein
MTTVQIKENPIDYLAWNIVPKMCQIRAVNS